MRSHNGETLQRLAYELSLRALGHQEEALNELRGRTGTLLAASSLVASLIGARAIGTDGRGWVAAGALAAFAISVGNCVYVLVPKTRLIFAVRGTALFEAEFADPGELPETHRRLAYWLEQYLDSNQPTITRLFNAYRAATVAVFAEVILWILKVSF